MLRSLLIRQGLLAVDVFLALLILVVGAAIVQRAFETDDAIARIAATALSSAAERPNYVRQMPDRSAFESIARTDLFGAAAKTAGAVEVAEEKPLEVQETTLPLRLFGTVTSGPQDPLASAVIENGQTRVTDVYYLNQTVMDEVILKEILHKEVRLLNKKTNTLEVLRVDETSRQVAGGGSPGGASVPGGRSVASGSSRSGVRGDRPNQVSINRTELMTELSQLNPTEFYAQLSPQLKRDNNGNVIGITSPNIGKIPLAQKYGFKDGDVIQTINGVTIDSEQRIMEVLARYQNAPTHYVSILRDGKPQTLVFRVE